MNSQPFACRPDLGAALVTGGAVRIGRALCLALARRGHAVAIHCHQSTAAAEALRAEIEAGGGRAAILRGDLNDHAATQALLPAAQVALGPVAVLVNNASLFEYDRLDSADLASWQRHMDANLRAPFFLAQAFAAALPAGMAGNIVNIIDQRVWRLTPHFATYTLSKAGLWTLTQTLAMALAPHIRVNGIGPGPVLPSSRQSPEQFARQWASTPLQRGAAPEEIAAGLLFLLDAPAMTGQMIALDGGQHLPWPPPGQAAGPGQATGSAPALDDPEE